MRAPTVRLDRFGLLGALAGQIAAGLSRRHSTGAPMLDLSSSQDRAETDVDIMMTTDRPVFVEVRRGPPSTDPFRTPTSSIRY